MSQAALSDRAYRKIINSWCMYDWANSAFATTLMAAMFPPFYREMAITAGLSEANVARASLRRDGSRARPAPTRHTRPHAGSPTVSTRAPSSTAESAVGPTFRLTPTVTAISEARTRSMPARRCTRASSTREQSPGSILRRGLTTLSARSPERLATPARLLPRAEISVTGSRVHSDRRGTGR